jgi:hydrophobe/amphiphile efflux-3 (HAE3) family protein
MRLEKALAAVIGAAARRPLAVALAVLVPALGGGALALGLEPSAATETLVAKDTASFRATERYHQRFGDDAIIVLVRGPLRNTVLTDDLGRVIGLEGCLSGNAPKGVTPRGGRDGPCARLAREKPVKVVFGPGTFINESVRQISVQFNAQREAKTKQADRAGTAAYRLARARGYSKSQASKLRKQARDLVFAEFFRDTAQLALRYGLRAVPRIDDPDFVSQLVFDSSGKSAPGCPKKRFAYLFPTCNSALIQVRLKDGLSEAKRDRAIALVRQAAAMPDWKPTRGQSYVVTGAPVVVSDLTDSISSSIVTLLIAALLVMALTLAVVFSARLRLLPLVVALAAAGITFGVLAALGASLTMASIAVLPVLIGLAVDYSIQLQSRAQEGTLSRGAPTVAIAAAATAAGFAVLALSPVPMVRGFGILLVGGIAVAFVCAITLGLAALRGLSARRPPRPVEEALRGAGDLVLRNPPACAAGRRIADLRDRVLAGVVARPSRVVGIALAVAALGWALDTQTKVESDVQKLVPRDLPALQDLEALQKSTGVGGQIDVMVSSDRLTEPEVVNWMTKYQGALLKRFGYDASKNRGCGKAELCPAFSLPDLFRDGNNNETQESIEALLDAVPPYFSQGVLSADRRTATLAFGIRLMPLDRQQEVIQEMRKRLDPPEGVRAELAGLPVLAAEANDKVASPWRRLLMLFAGLLAVAVVLLAILRSWRRAVIPLVPIALATGWSALVLFATRVPLNPMSVTLGALVIAISTEFSVLLSERYRAERIAGLSPREALARTYASTGAAVMASGATAIAGFAVLVVSDIRMLRDFGLVTVIDLTVSLLGVLVVLPAVLLLAEDRLAFTLPSLRLPRPRLPRRPRRRPARAPAG